MIIINPSYGNWSYTTFDSETDTNGALLTIIYTDTELEQEGFRWRDDDGSESGASWAQNQDVDHTIAKNTNVRLRILLDATGDPDTDQFELQYKRSDEGAAEWRKIPEA